MDLDLEELSFPLSIVFLLCALASIALIYLPNIPFPDFYLVVFSTVSLIASVLCLAVNLIYMWQAPEPYPYYPVKGSLEYSQSNQILRTNDLNPQKDETVSVAPPTREELQRLKDVLGIKKGSLQYKQRGAGVYCVVYSRGKHCWERLGGWKELKQKLDV